MSLLKFLLCAILVSVQACNDRYYDVHNSFVCVCDEKYCDDLPQFRIENYPKSVIYTTSKGKYRFAEDVQNFENGGEIAENTVFIDYQGFQSILGWGGAITDSSGVNILSLSETMGDKLLRSYFGDEGLQYNLARIPMGGTDFSLRPYSYDDGPEDVNLTNFRLQDEDFKLKIPLIEKAKILSDDKLKLLASAWAPPAWMKTNNKTSGLLGFLRKEMYQSWANYTLKFLDEYNERGINFWGLTTGNEPSLGFIPDFFIKTPSLAWFFSDMKTWIEENLGPTIRNSKYSDIKLLALDDQRFFLPWAIQELFESKAVEDFIDGIAVHWYFDYYLPDFLLTKTHNKFPNKFILSTEASRERFFWENHHVSLGSWQNAEEYANNIIGDMNNWVTGWIDWNIALNEQGGPTYTGNHLNSPIIVNETSNEFYKQPAYYILGHFSRFIPENSVKISATQFSKKVPVTAFLRPDNGTVIVLLNRQNKEVAVNVVLINKNSTLTLNLVEKSITTVIFY